MQTTCLLFSVEQLKEKNNFDLAYSLIKDKGRKDKINSCLFDGDKRLSLGVGLLLEFVKKKFNLLDCPILTQESGKPYFFENPVHFNCSHGKELVAVAISSSPVGVDLESVKDKRQNIIDKYFVGKEKVKGIESEKAFYEVWTKKESYLKRQGKTIFNLKEFDVYSLEVLENADFFMIEKNGYVITVCVDKNQTVEWQTLEMQDIFSEIN